MGNTFQSFPTKLNRVSNILKKRLLRFAKANPQQYIPEFFWAGIQKPAVWQSKIIWTKPPTTLCLPCEFSSRRGSKRACSTGCVSERKKVSSTSELTKRAKPPPGKRDLVWKEWSYHANPGSFIFRGYKWLSPIHWGWKKPALFSRFWGAKVYWYIIPHILIDNTHIMHTIFSSTHCVGFTCNTKKPLISVFWIFQLCFVYQRVLAESFSLSVSILKKSTVQPSGGPDGRRTLWCFGFHFWKSTRKTGNLLLKNEYLARWKLLYTFFPPPPPASIRTYWSMIFNSTLHSIPVNGVLEPFPPTFITPEAPSTTSLHQVQSRLHGIKGSFDVLCIEKVDMFITTFAPQQGLQSQNRSKIVVESLVLLYWV